MAMRAAAPDPMAARGTRREVRRDIATALSARRARLPNLGDHPQQLLRRGDAHLHLQQAVFPDPLILRVLQAPQQRPLGHLEDRRGLLDRRAIRGHADRLIRDYEIATPDAETRAGSLSGGNQQKIVVARALNGDPEWIVAMNPTRGLDIGATRFVHDQLRAARARGASRTRAVLRHALRNSLIPIVTVIGLQFGAVLTGAVITAVFLPKVSQTEKAKQTRGVTTT